MKTIKTTYKVDWKKTAEDRQKSLDTLAGLYNQAQRDLSGVQARKESLRPTIRSLAKALDDLFDISCYSEFELTPDEKTLKEAVQAFLKATEDPDW